MVKAKINVMSCGVIKVDLAPGNDLPATIFTFFMSISNQGNLIGFFISVRDRIVCLFPLLFSPKLLSCF